MMVATEEMVRGSEASTPKEKIKVLYYNHSADVSGAEISLLLTIKHMPDTVEAVLAAPEGELLERARKEGIAVRQIKSHRARMSRSVWTTVKGVVGTFAAGWRLRKVLRDLEPEVLHANSIRAGLIAVIATYRKPAKLVWHVRDNLPHNRIGRLIRRVAIVKPDRLIAISQAIMDNFAHGAPLKTKMRVVHNGVDTTDLGRVIREEIGSSTCNFVIGVVGQIAPWKRQLDAVEVFSEFHRDHSDSELWIVGEPKFRSENNAYYDRIKFRVTELGLVDCIRFLGFRADVMNVMASINVLLVPSENEPFGRVLIEAMLAGNPVIGTCAGGIPEIVLDGETGFLVPVGDVSAMVSKLKYLYDGRFSEPTSRMFGQVPRNRAVSQFSIDHCAKKVLAVYQGLAITQSAPSHGSGCV